MQHKASGPLLGLWPRRALVTLVATLGLVISGYLTIAALTGGGTPEGPPDAVPPVSEEGNSPDATSPPTEGRTPKESPSESDRVRVRPTAATGFQRRDRAAGIGPGDGLTEHTFHQPLAHPDQRATGRHATEHQHVGGAARARRSAVHVQCGRGGVVRLQP